MDEDDASMMSVDDISSSTDPLLDTAATPASRSVTPAIPARQPASAHRGRLRNQHQPTPRTQRVQALRESTPRKRMFELDVGDARSPQRLLVTIEAESSRVTSRSSVSRRLFQHSTPTARSLHERERTTSVTVPLRGAEDGGDDEITRLGEFVTPARPHGRPPRTATPGTALRSETPKTTTRPMRPATPGFRLREARSSSKDVLDSDVTIDFSKLGFTPGTKRRISLTPGPSSRAPKRRKGVSGTSPVRQLSLLGPGSVRKKRGRPRKDSIAHDEFSALIERDLTALKEDESDHEAGAQAEPSRDQETRTRNREQEHEHIRRERTFQRERSNVVLENTGIGAPSSDAPRLDESEGDIWLENSFNPPQDTPAARRWNGEPRAQPSRVEQLRPEPARRETPQLDSELSHGDEYVEFADFGGGESHSDIESELDDDNATPRDTPVGQTTETRLPGEEFTMIDPYSLLSMQQNSSYVEDQGREAAQNEEARDGDTTSFYISNTIKSLRISQQEQESDERASYNRTIDYSVNPNLTTTPRVPPPGYDPLYRYSTGDNKGEAEVVEEVEDEDVHESEEALEQHYSKFSGRQKTSEREREEEQGRDISLNREPESEPALEPQSKGRSEPKPESRPGREAEAEPQHEPESEPGESDIWFQVEPRKRQRREPQKGQQHEPEPEREPKPASESRTWLREEQRQAHQHQIEMDSDRLYEQEANRTRRFGVEREAAFEPISGNTPDFEPLPERRSESPEEPEYEPESEPHYEEEQEQEYEQGHEFEDNLESEQQQETEAEAQQEQALQLKSWRVKFPNQEGHRSVERQRNEDIRGNDGVDSSARSMNYDQFERQESSVLYHGHLRRNSRGARPPEPSSPLFRKSQTDVQQQTTKTSIQPSVERPSSVNISTPLYALNSILTPAETPSPVPPEPRDYDFQCDFGSHANVEADDHGAEFDEAEHRQTTIESAKPTLDNEMASSPPTGKLDRYEQKQRPEPPLRRVRSNSNETPADRLTSLASPSLPALNPQNLMPPPDSQNRPALSPIIRAGEALRQVTSDPPSPPSRGSFLRSPFRGMPGIQDNHSPSPSGSRPSQSQPQPPPQYQPLPQAQFETTPKQPQPERSEFGLFNSIKNLVAKGAQVLSPRNVSRQTSVNAGESSRQASATAGTTSHVVDVTMEDPFGPDPPGSSREIFGRNSLFGNMMGKRGAGSQDASGAASASASFENRDQASASASFERQSRASTSSDKQAYGYNGFVRQAEDYASFGREHQADAGFGTQRQVFGEPHVQGVPGFGGQRQIFGEPQPQANTSFERPAQADTIFGRQADASTGFQRTEAQASSSHAIKQPSVTTRFNTQHQANTSFGHQAEDSTMHDRQAQAETNFAGQRQATTSSFPRQPQPNTIFGSTTQAASSFSEREREQRGQHEYDHENEAMDWQAEEESIHNVTRDRSASASLGFHDSSRSRGHHDSSAVGQRTTQESSTRRSASVREDDHHEPEPKDRGHGYREVIETETVTEEREEERIWGNYGGSDTNAKSRSSLRESNHFASKGQGRPEKSSTSTLRRSVVESEEREKEHHSESEARGRGYRETVEVETATEEREEERIWGDYGGDAKSRSIFRESSHSSSRPGRDGHSRHGSSRHGSQRGSRQESRQLSEERETTRGEERERSEAKERGRSREVMEEVREEYEHEHESERYHSGGRYSTSREESRQQGSSRSGRSDRGKTASSRQSSEEQETIIEQEGRRERTEEITEEVWEEYEHEHESGHYHSGSGGRGRGEESRSQHGSSRFSNRTDRDGGKASSSFLSSSGERGGHRQQKSEDRQAREVREVTEEIVEERHEYEEERGGRRSSHVEESHRHWSRGGPRGSLSSRASESRRDDHRRSSGERESREVTEVEDERHEAGEEREGRQSSYVDESSHRQESQSDRDRDSWRREQLRSSTERQMGEAKEGRDDFAEDSREHRMSHGSQESRQRETTQHRTSRSSEGSHQGESLLDRGRTSSRGDQLRSSADWQVSKAEKARHDNYSEGEDYNMTRPEESHQCEEFPIEQRDENEQDYGMDYMEAERHYQAEQAEQAEKAQAQAQAEDEEEEEEDLFLLEAMRSSPAVNKVKSHLKENDPASFIPSAHQEPQPNSRWQSNKSQMVRDQLSTAADKSDEMEEFSLLHSSRAKKFKPALKPVPNKKANLSGFFSSPAPIPDLSLQGPKGTSSVLPKQPKTSDKQSQANRNVSSGAGALSERSHNLAPGQGERKLGTTPIGRVPSSQCLSVPGAQKPFQPSPLGTAPVLSGQPPSRPLQPPAQRVLRHSSSIVGSSSPPQAGSIYTPVPQKQNFTPMRREPGAKLPLFETNGTKSTATTAAPPKEGSGTTPNSITDKPKQLLFGIKESISKLFSDPPAKSVEYGQPDDNENEHENEQEQDQEQDQDQQPAEEEDLVLDDYDEIVELEEEQSSTEELFEPPQQLRPLPGKNSSPLRSALRPSYKPKGQTPGRAVQFVNSMRQSPTPKRPNDRPAFGGRETLVIITSSPSTRTESSPVASPSAGEERMQGDRRARYEEEYMDEEERKPDDEVGMDMDLNMDMDMDDSIQWYDDEPAPAPAARPPPIPRPPSPGRGRQEQLQPQRQPQVAAAPRQPAQPPLIKPTSTLENSPVIRSGISLFGHGRRRPLPPPIPPSNRNIVQPLQPLQPPQPSHASQQLYPTLPPLSPLNQQPAQSSSSALASTSQHLNPQISAAASTAGTSTLARASTSATHNHQLPTHEPLPAPTCLWTTSHWEILSSTITHHRSLLRKGKHLPFPIPPHLQSFLGKTYRPSAQQTTYDPLSGLPVDESVVIEQWHLDVVYEFREMFKRVWEGDKLYGKVFGIDEEERGGWSEGELVRRVYAYLVGDRRRAEGRVDKTKRRGVVR